MAIASPAPPNAPEGRILTDAAAVAAGGRAAVCAVCRYWLRREHLGGASGVGECRRWPPVALGLRQAMFPMTKGHDFCGEQSPAQ